MQKITEVKSKLGLLEVMESLKVSSNEMVKMCEELKDTMREGFEAYGLEVEGHE